MFSKSLQMALILIFYANGVAFGQSPTDFAKILLQSEQRLGLPNLPTTEAEALAARDLELRRTEFARHLQLQSEGIVPAKDVDKARLQYEKLLIKAGAKRKKLTATLKELDRQRNLVIEHIQRQQMLAGSRPAQGL
jgi:multidrug resistance efflux pump